MTVLEYLKDGVKPTDRTGRSGQYFLAAFEIAKSERIYADRPEIKFKSKKAEEAFKTEFEKFISDAINEKIEREKEAQPFRKWLVEGPKRGTKKRD